jgi:Cu-Zn family superoxide dismutase
MKKLKFSMLTLAAGLLLFSCEKKAEESVTDVETEEVVIDNQDTADAMVLDYEITPKSGSAISGKVNFTQTGDEVMMTIKVVGLTPGDHGIHIHEVADCSAEDGSSAGGHWDPAGSDHGKWGEEHFHMGDIGNLVANAEGVAEMTFSTDKWCIGCDDDSKNILGHSLIIHADADDYHSQPTGNAGGRIGCVEIR